MQALQQLFLVEVDLEQLGSDLSRNGVKDQKWFSVVESFIESFDQEKELVQLLGVTQIHVDNPSEKQLFSKSFFRLTDDSRLEQISGSRPISREEYYERLIHQTGESVESKIRLTFSMDGVKFLFDFAKASSATIVQVEKTSNNSKKFLEDSFERLKSVNVIDQFDLTLEELSYRLYSS